ncbi:class II aldolase/adducin N-terminal [Kalaharituber pfeilii]|nr:class II aldolase/adducin N-terminal [Kalaharituber pfeilii]
MSSPSPPPPTASLVETFDKNSLPSSSSPLITSTSTPDAKPTIFRCPPTFTDPYEERKHLKSTLACAFRSFARHDFNEGNTGYITVRDSLKGDCFWVNLFGLHFSLIKASDLILVDSTGNVIDGGANRMLNTAAFMIHAAAHKEKPEINCAAHSVVDFCAFWDDHVAYERFGGIVAILENHGLLTTGQDIEEAIFWFITMENCYAAAGGGYKTQKIGPEEAAFTYKIVGAPTRGWFSGRALFEKVIKEGAEFDDE